MSCLLSIDGVDNLATARAFGPDAGFIASCLILDDCVPLGNCLATERTGAMNCFLIIRDHLDEFDSSFRGEGACDTVLKLVRLLRPTQLYSLRPSLRAL